VEHPLCRVDPARNCPPLYPPPAMRTPSFLLSSMTSFFNRTRRLSSSRPARTVWSPLPPGRRFFLCPNSFCCLMTINGRLDVRQRSFVPPRPASGLPLSLSGHYESVDQPVQGKIAPIPPPPSRPRSFSPTRHLVPSAPLPRIDRKNVVDSPRLRSGYRRMAVTALYRFDVSVAIGFSPFYPFVGR